MKNLFVFFLCALFSPLFSDSIEGMWDAIDDKTHKPGCVVMIYKHGDYHYGRIVATYDQETGKVFDTIDDPKKKAPGIQGNPYYCGLDMIWDLAKVGDVYEGKLVDPEKGNSYDADVWAKGSTLYVKGKLLVFSSTQKWPATKRRKLPWSFKPNPKKFDPKIPTVK